MTEKISFPQYRKNATGSSYYKIISADEFIEIQKIGSKIWQHKVIATQFPEKLLIQDMLAFHDNLWQEISEQEFLDLMS